MPQMTDRPEYLLGNVPNNDEGAEFWRLLLKYKNPRYRLRRRGNGARPSKAYYQSLPLDMSQRFRVYADDQDVPKQAYEWHKLRRKADNLAQLHNEDMEELCDLAIKADNLELINEELRNELSTIPRTLPRFIRHGCLVICINSVNRLYDRIAGLNHELMRLADRLEAKL